MVLGLPSLISQFLNFVIEIINLKFVGHYGDAAIIAGVGFANTYINLMYLAVVSGLNGTLQAIVSHSKGSGNNRMSGIYVNRGRVVVLCWQPIIAICSLYLEKFLLAIEVDAATARNSQLYVIRCLPGLAFYSQYDVAR